MDNNDKKLDDIKINDKFISNPVSSHNIGKDSDNNDLVKKAASDYDKRLINMKNNNNYLKKQLKKKKKKS